MEADPTVGLRSNPAPNLEDYGLFQNPYDPSNNPVGGIKDVLPIKRNDDPLAERDSNLQGTIVATNDKKGDWNRMDNVVGYEVDLYPSEAVNQVVYAAPGPNKVTYSAPEHNQAMYEALERTQVPHPATAPYQNQVAYTPNQVAYAASNPVAYAEPEPNPDREPRNKNDSEEKVGL